MQHSCSVCGKAFETSRSHARYCSSTCRGKAMKARKAEASATGAAEVVQFSPSSASARSVASELGHGEAEPPGLVDVVTRQLRAANKLDTYAGQQALVLAGRLARSVVDTGSAVAALSKELDRLMSAALADVKPEPDLLDEVVGEVVQMRTRRRG